ncbi:T9SS type A sorting domain-containing protein [Candidatus Poribacteria bacterium]|nr:T9SS type A sorting domain-containing protein [Candidatus Poribacteria bacterium]
MKTFSRISLFMLVCVGFVLLLGTNRADAQSASLAYKVDPALLEYEPNQEVTLTFTLTVDDNPEPAEKLTIAASSGITVTVPPSNGGITNARGQVTMKITVGRTPPRNVTARWAKLNNISATANFDPAPPELEAPIIAVLAPDSTDIAVGDTFSQTIEIRDVADLSAWQMDIVFNPNILELVEVTEGDFLAQGGYNAFFPVINIADSNANGRIRASQARIGRKTNANPPPNNVIGPNPDGVDRAKNAAAGTGDLITLKFKALQYAEEPLGLHNVQLSDEDGERISYSILVTNLLVVTHEYPAEDVNRDGTVNVIDLVMVASDMGASNSNLGEATPINPRTDVNDDGFVNVLDLIAVSSSRYWGQTVTPARQRAANKPSLSAPAASVEALTPATIQGWIDLAQVEDDGSIVFDHGIANLQTLLASRIPNKTRLLLNYPNPFNPETWIPYQLSEASDVTVTIHAMNGSLIRTLTLGHQAAGIYQSKSQAAYWDGRNELGEQVASGLYFYTLTAGNFSATGKMLVRK